MGITMPHNLPPGVTRGPDGQFVSTDGSRFDDIEVASGNKTYIVVAADLDGSTAAEGGQQFPFEGDACYQLDDLLDRHESGQMLYGWHSLNAYVNSTATADGMTRAALEVSTSGSRQVAQAPNADGDDPTATVQVNGNRTFDDTLDLIGPHLQSIGFGGFSDGATGVGGGGSSEGQVWYGVPADPEFHPRDEVQVNGILTNWNMDDAAIHADLTYQHVYGIVRE